MIVLLSGANDFAVRQALDKLTSDFVNKHGVHAVERVDAEQFEAARLSELLQGASLFASHRLVILQGAGRNKPLWEALGEWAERVPSEVVLVLAESAPDKRTRTFKQIQKHGKVQDFAQLSEPELAAWLQREAKRQGGSIDAHSARHLVGRVGQDQWQLHTELLKLLGNNPTVTVEAIDQLVEPNPQVSAFDLLDAVLAGDGAKASTLLARLKTIEDPYKLFGLLVSQMQTLVLVVTADGKSLDVIAKESGVHPFVVRKMQPIARRISYAQLQQMLRDVAHTDTQFKSTGVDPWMLLGKCLGKIASRDA